MNLIKSIRKAFGKSNINIFPFNNWVNVDEYSKVWYDIVLKYVDVEKKGNVFVGYKIKPDVKVLYVSRTDGFNDDVKKEKYAIKDGGQYIDIEFADPCELGHYKEISSIRILK